MYVKTASAKVHFQLEELFGMPEITDPINIETFGPYYLGEPAIFWTHDPKTKIWSVEYARHEGDNDIAISWLPNIEDVPDFTSTMDVVRTMARPCQPDNEDIRHDGVKFIYDCVMFQWIFFPELRRWEAAPISVIQRENY